MQARTQPASDRVPLVARPTTVWTAVYLLVAALLATWSLAMPLMASPDEPSHVVKAAAVVRGELGGRLGEAPTDGSAPGAPTYVTIPDDLAAAQTLPDCFRFEGEISAACQQGVPARSGDVEAVTYAGQYPPVYYALVGWPSLLLEGEAAFYAMRLVSAALSAFLMVWGLRRLWREHGSRGLWGGVLALTPMCLFLGGTVNPNGLEIAAGFAFWTACLAIGRGREGRGPVPRSVFVQAAVAGALLVTMRTSGPVWGLLVVAIAAVAARPGAIRDAVRRPAGWAVLGVAAVAGVVAAGWILTHGEIVSTSELFPGFGSPTLVLAVMLMTTPAFFEQMIGNFGWLDTSAPYPTAIAWQSLVALVLLVALVHPGARRPRVALAGLCVAVVAVPIALTIPTAAAAGIVWQGRYVLPLAVGVPILAAAILTTVGPEVSRLLDRFARVSFVALGLGHVLAFYWAARRYADGADGEWLPLRPEWVSPIGFLSAVALYALVVGALMAAALWATRGRSSAAPTDGQPQLTGSEATTTDRSAAAATPTP